MDIKDSYVALEQCKNIAKAICKIGIILPRLAENDRKSIIQSLEEDIKDIQELIKSIKAL